MAHELAKVQSVTAMKRRLRGLDSPNVFDFAQNDKESRFILLLLPQSYTQGRVNSLAVNHEADLTCEEFPHVADLYF